MKSNVVHIMFIGLLLAALATPVASAQTVSSTDTTAKYTMRGTYYSDKFIGRKTSSGEVFSQELYTAAHHSLKFGTLLLVTNPKNGKQVIVRVNDRCPKRNILDLTRKSARQLGITSHPVEVEVLPPRYYAMWEHQERFIEVLDNGKFREYVSAIETSLQTEPGKLYNLELFRCKNREEARHRVERLPIFYQDQVAYRQRGTVNGVVAILETPLTYLKAEFVKKELSALFPDIKVVEIK